MKTLANYTLHQQINAINTFLSNMQWKDSSKAYNLSPLGFSPKLKVAYPACGGILWLNHKPRTLVFPPKRLPKLIVEGNMLLLVQLAGLVAVQNEVLFPGGSTFILVVIR